MTLGELTVAVDTSALRPRGSRRVTVPSTSKSDAAAESDQSAFAVRSPCLQKHHFSCNQVNSGRPTPDIRCRYVSSFCPELR